jgi:hypothetical protein
MHTFINRFNVLFIVQVCVPCGFLMLQQAAADAVSALAVYFGEVSSSSSSSSTTGASQEIFAALASFARHVAACDIGIPV